MKSCSRESWERSLFSMAKIARTELTTRLGVHQNGQDALLTLAATKPTMLVNTNM